MSIVLMFIFWYCHKRGKEVRLANQANGESIEAVEDSGADDTVDEGDEEGDSPEYMVEAESGDGKFEDMQKYQEMLKSVEERAETLSKPTATEVPVPDEGERKHDSSRQPI